MLRYVKPGRVSVGGARSLFICTIDLRIAFAALALGLSCLAGLAGSAFAGTYGYAQVPLAWIDNTAHTNVTWGGSAQCAAWNGAPVDDDGTAPINIGFNFTFGATVYTQVRINSNGRLQFGNNYCGYGTQTVGPPPTYPYNYPNGNMNNTMRVYGADFCPGGGGAGCSGRVTYTVAPLGVAPNRQFVVTWSQMKEWNSGTSLFNVQMVLSETGDFIYQYKDIANVSQGAGQIGYQLSAADFALVDMTTINSLAYSSVRFFRPTPPLAEYRLDECSGATAADASGNGYNGTLVGGMTVASAGRICTSDTFNGSTGYIGLPAGFPKLGSTLLGVPPSTNFTIASWINSTDAAKSGQRIYVDDQNNTGGFAISLGDGGTGRLRFFSRAVSPVILDSPAVIAANNWYFVVATHDATLKKRRLMVHSAGGSLISDVSDTYTGTWGSDAGAAAIGGENLASTENSSNFRFQGRLDETRIYSRVLADTEIAAIYANEVQGLQRDGSLRICTPCNATLGNFNAFDTSTAVGSVTGVIRTKIAGAALAASSGNIDVVSLSGGALASFTGNTTVQFLDASNNSGAMDTKGCRATWTPILTDAGLASFALAFVAQNRVSLPARTPVNSWPEVRLRIINAIDATQYGCSNDAFAIRPSYVNTVGALARDADWQTGGNARSLNNLAASGGIVHAAGKPFSLSGLTARNAVNATTTNYAGNPTLVPGNLVLPDPTYCATNGYTCLPGTFTVGSWNYASGVLSSTSAAYSEAGAFSWEVEDRSFAVVDAADSTKIQRYFRSNAVIYTGRFVPASYQLNLNTPQLQAACTAGGFTYLGQPFGYFTPPSIVVRAMNGATTPVQTANYLGVVGSGGLWTLATPLAYGSAVCTAPTQTCALLRQSGTTRFNSTYALGTPTPGWDGTNLAAQTGNATIISTNNGAGTLGFGATDKLVLYRNPAAPQAPYTAAVTLALQLDDYSEAGAPTPATCATAPVVAGNPTCISGALAATALAFSSANPFRYGVLKLDSAFGSELLDVRIPVSVKYWNTNKWDTHAADSCTSLPASSIALGNYIAPPAGTAVSAANMGIAPTDHRPAGTVALVGGVGTIVLVKPGPVATGTFDVVVNLGTGLVSPNSCEPIAAAFVGGTGTSLGYLLGNWCGAAYDRAPSARVKLGASKAPYIYLRERY